MVNSITVTGIEDNTILIELVEIIEQVITAIPDIGVQIGEAEICIDEGIYKIK
jgi:hypothetical protein